MSMVKNLVLFGGKKTMLFTLMMFAYRMSPLMVPAATVMCSAKSTAITATPANPKKSSKLM